MTYEWKSHKEILEIVTREFNHDPKTEITAEGNIRISPDQFNPWMTGGMAEQTLTNEYGVDPLAYTWNDYKGLTIFVSDKP